MPVTLPPFNTARLSGLKPTSFGKTSANAPRFGSQQPYTLSAEEIDNLMSRTVIPGGHDGEHLLVDSLNLLPEAEQIPRLERILEPDFVHCDLKLKVLLRSVPRLSNEETRLSLLEKAAQSYFPPAIRMSVPELLQAIPLTRPGFEDRATQLLINLSGDPRKWGYINQAIVKTAANFQNSDNKVKVAIAALKGEAIIGTSKLNQAVQAISESFTSQESGLLLTEAVKPENSDIFPEAMQIYDEPDSEVKYQTILKLAQEQPIGEHAEERLLISLLADFEPRQETASLMGRIVNVGGVRVYSRAVNLLPFIEDKAEQSSWIDLFADINNSDTRTALAKLVQSGQLKQSEKEQGQLVGRLLLKGLGVQPAAMDALSSLPEAARREAIDKAADQFKGLLEQYSDTPSATPPDAN